MQAPSACGMTVTLLPKTERSGSEQATCSPPPSTDQVAAWIDGLDTMKKMLAKSPDTSLPTGVPPAVAAPAAAKKDDCVKVVVQRCNSASLLVDNKDRWEGIGRGMLLYVSFAKGASPESAAAAARALLYLPLMTLGKWGDGSKTVSLLDILYDERSAGTVADGVSVMVSG